MPPAGGRCAGGLFRKGRNAGRALYYAIWGNPLNKAASLPVAKMVTNEHRSESIRRLIQERRRKEMAVFQQFGNTILVGLLSDFPWQ